MSEDFIVHLVQEEDLTLEKDIKSQFVQIADPVVRYFYLCDT